jgi:AraC-like DNA-binding protein
VRSLSLKYPPIAEINYKRNSKMKPFFHTHLEYEIYYFHSGKASYWIGGSSIELMPGDLIIMNGTSEHGPVMDEQYTYIRSTVMFDESSIGPLMLLPGSIDVIKPFQLSAHYHWRLNEELKAEVEHIFTKIGRYDQPKDLLAYNRLRAAFHELLLFIYERFQETADSSKAIPGQKEKTVQNVIAYIEQHYMDDLTLDELVGQMHVSRFYLMKLFKQLTGSTLFDYINERRIKQAKVLFFLDPSHTVTYVCFQTGFKHLSHFSRTFKRIVGLTPENYRKLL